jgi:hypothetical protein
MFIIDNKAIEINTTEAFYQLLTEIFREHSLSSVFIKGTYWTWGGDQIYKIFSDELITERPKIDALFETIVKSGYLFQETIRQHPEMDRLNPSCVNTIRMDTFIDDRGNIEIISGFLRTSLNNLHVDNTSKGGGSIIIDLETGKLRAECYGGFTTDVGVPIRKHPKTQVVFEDFQIPYFKEAKELIIKAAAYMPGLRLIGWDIGIAESGPILIEGNPDYAMVGNDIAAGGFLSSPVFRKAWNEFHSRKN